MSAYLWYKKLHKPSWAPPGWLFAPVWSILYIIIAVSFSAVYYLAVTKRIPGLVALPFALNIVFNLSFTSIQFGLKNNVLAAIDVLLVLGTLAWGIVAIFSYAEWIAYAQVPYFLWVAFATVLQITITSMNWGRSVSDLARR